MLSSSLFAQSIYLEKNKFALDLGLGYSINNFGGNINDYNSMLYNVSCSFLSIIDIGFQYSDRVVNNKIEKLNSYSIDLHISKNPVGVAINTAYASNYLLLGMSFYKIVNINDIFFADKVIPIISIGVIVPNQLFSYSFGLAFQNDINDHIKVAFTSGLNASENIEQLFFGLELIIN